MKLGFEKWSGCGNDYIFLDFALSGQAAPAGFPSPAAIRSLSERKSGLGSDGLILLLPPQESARADIRMQMYNSDGTESEMCGNGLRCLAAMAHERRPDLKKIRVETKAGLRECEILGGTKPLYQVRANMGRPSFLPANVPVLFEDVMVVDEAFEVGGEEFRVSCVSMGNPHCVIEVKNLDDFPVEKFGPLIENHEVFPNRTNVEFIERKGEQVRQRTWERGAGETKACGTGACAVAVTLLMRKRLDSPVEIQLRGGKLKVFWDGLREVYLEGEALFEGSGFFEWNENQPEQIQILN